MLIALPVLARIAADAQPIAPRPAALRPLPAHPRSAPLRDLPVGLRPGAPPRRLEDARASAVALLGARGAQRLLAQIDTPRFRFAQDRTAYPYRYPGVDAVLAALPARLSRAQVAAATDLGARLMLLRSGPAAFAVLDRARAGGDCAPQLNLLLLVASDANAHDQIVAPGGRARRARLPGRRDRGLAARAVPEPAGGLGSHRSARSSAPIRARPRGGAARATRTCAASTTSRARSSRAISMRRHCCATAGRPACGPGRRSTPASPARSPAWAAPPTPPPCRRASSPRSRRPRRCRPRW